ncbi:urease accessory protein [Microvirga lupini]|uniref:Urease accessory protein n=1 Tax=Microvirga lupini TaxID=420324 RepID=A0A7W4VJ74_9HYPH|nr:HupE/UreJ family protein [Microvirga lupini]MBB3018176.1 urease accessory protein [Microvirga lupini]
MKIKHTILAAAMSLAATPALAHNWMPSDSGFSAGFLHPFGGSDHMLTMVGVGLFAASLRGRALIAVPASFVLMMLVGGAFGIAGFHIPAVEAVIVASVIAMGIVVALGWSWPVGAAAMLAGLMALFHGYAHGAEIPAGATVLPYCAGFMLASTALQSLGILMGHIILRQGKTTRPLGAIIMFAGLVLTFG